MTRRMDEVKRLTSRGPIAYRLTRLNRGQCRTLLEDLCKGAAGGETAA